MRLRRLTAEGVEDFAAYIRLLTTDPTVPPPTELLEDEERTELLKKRIDFEPKMFSSRFDAAAYLYDTFVSVGLSDIDLDTGVWSWLTLFWFDALRPPTGKNVRHWPGERARWIPAVSNYRKFYKHLLASPWRTYRTHHDNPQRALVLLCGPLYPPLAGSEEILSRQELVTNRGAVELATRMYYDPAQEKLKRGAAGKGPGSVRRYVETLNQFGVTWDLYAMDANEIARMLPDEFGRFLSRSS